MALSTPIGLSGNKAFYGLTAPMMSPISPGSSFLTLEGVNGQAL